MAYDSSDFVELTQDPLSLQQISERVQRNNGGAIALFCGTTRDHFNGKAVLRLEYEAYEPMALKELKKICLQLHQQYELLAIGIVHRLGVVPIGETSVVVAISSIHRREALEACHHAIDTLKATVPIWKKEVYTNGEVWKANPEALTGCGCTKAASEVKSRE
eukprot:NODE_6096_length_573_cov_23.293722_g5931_i0.p1 GENE.NODE_6096_length_573_cov_23.293722_g5931_i0~~NODE_6096_length_573_cov_23.293722_g5931_i0.p1  ORF type:complete len:177 (-),score=52.08 NODE_6096_length_573_cov_23.293722_g5931_i0:43-528(-)